MRENERLNVIMNDARLAGDRYIAKVKSSTARLNKAFKKLVMRPEEAHRVLFCLGVARCNGDPVGEFARTWA